MGAEVSERVNIPPDKVWVARRAAEHADPVEACVLGVNSDNILIMARWRGTRRPDQWQANIVVVPRHYWNRRYGRRPEELI